MRFLPPFLLSLVFASCVTARKGEVWVADLAGDDPGVGSQRVLLKLDVDDDGERVEVVGGSRRGAMSTITGKMVVGVYEAFTRRHGALVELAGEGAGTEDAPLVLRVDAPTGELIASGVRAGDGFRGRWDGAGLGARSGTFTLVPREPASGEPEREGDDLEPLEDYAAIFDAFRAELEARFVFPARLADPDVQAELDAARDRAKDVVDDFEFVALVMRACKELAPSTVVLRRAHKPDGAKVALEWRGDVAVIRCGPLFDALEPLDAAFQAAGAAAALVLDLRGSCGYDLTPGRILAYLATEAEPIGYMLGRKRADDGAFSDEARDKLPVLTGTYSYKLYRRALSLAGVAAGGAAPLAEGAFLGPVCVLIDGETRAGVEPIADYLQRSGRATLVGSKTAGASVDAEMVPLEGTEWTAIIPVATWVAWDGTWMERRKIRPDVEVEPEDERLALDVALELLAEKLSDSL